MTTELYKQAQQASKAASERNDCAIKAVSIATGTEYRVIRDMSLKLGRRPRKGTDPTIVYRMLKDLGYTVKRVESPVSTVGQLDDAIIGDDNTYLAYVSGSGHVLCAKNGEVHDWTKYRKHQICDFLKILKENAENGVDTPDSTPDQAENPAESAEIAENPEKIEENPAETVAEPDFASLRAPQQRILRYLKANGPTARKVICKEARVDNSVFTDLVGSTKKAIRLVNDKRYGVSLLTLEAVTVDEATKVYSLTDAIAVS
jgi:hypothetical protein